MKCTSLLACEKLIIDKDGAHSLINVMLNAAVVLQQQSSGQLPQQLAIPPDAVMPLQWWIYAVWRPSTSDVEQTFEQVYQLYWPNGEKFAESRLSFVQKENRLQQTSFFFSGFPAGQTGDIKIVSWLDSKGHRVSDILETIVRVDHIDPANTPTGPPAVAGT
jgi:hypothetical protein